MAWTDSEMDAWLGPALEDMTDEQRTDFRELADQIMDRWPTSQEDPEAGSEQLSGALQIILGDATLENLGKARLRARAEVERAAGRLQGAILASRGESPTELARRSGMTRAAIYSLLG